MRNPAVEQVASNRKRLGQYFTGIRLARLLAALAAADQATSILDPMAGSGDMLQGALELHSSRVFAAGIEIDLALSRLCQSRLEKQATIVGGDAFQPDTWNQLPGSWDLVITNPPYVRYQDVAGQSVHGLPNGQDIRHGLMGCLAQADNLADVEKRVFVDCARGYSGLADMAVPAWMLAASRVATGGRLALVVPNTWLSRDYAAPVVYLLRRFFDLEFVVDDMDMNWFADALVRTTLVVATRVPDKGTAFGEGCHLKISLPAAVGGTSSLVERICVSENSELVFAAAVRDLLTSKRSTQIGAVRTKISNEQDLIGHLERSAEAQQWPEVKTKTRRRQNHVAEELSRFARRDVQFVSLADLGWTVGQGLRSGANDCFYVKSVTNGMFESSVMPGVGLELPDDAMLPAIRRQTDLRGTNGREPSSTSSHVLVLEGWALGEDIKSTEGPKPWKQMQGDLEELVRVAAEVKVRRGCREVCLPELSAVKTNVRISSPRSGPARFWYQLPRLRPRHRPSLFLARVNGSTPRPFLNPGGAWVVDANFSTLWPIEKEAPDRHLLLALLSSSWCRAYFELIGTVMGGSALKLEATHLRQILLPMPGESESGELLRLGMRLSRNIGDEIQLLRRIDQTVASLLGCDIEEVASLNELAMSLESARIY